MKNPTKASSKMKATLLAGVLAVSIALTGCSAKSGLMGGGKVATVDGTVITKVEYDKAYNEFTKAFGLEKMPEQQRAPLTEMIKQMTLQKLIMKTLITNEAEKAGLKVTDEDLKKYKEEKIFSNPAMKEQFQAFLKQSALKEADFDAMLKENLLISKFMDTKGGTQVQVSEAEAKQAYEQNKAQFKLPEQIHAEHILVKAVVPEMKKELRTKNPKITDAELATTIAAEQAEKKTKAEQLLKEVKASPAKFQEIAKASSDDEASARNGGDLGFMSEQTTDPDFWTALKKTPDKAMYPGLVSTVYGYHIVRVKEHSAAHQETFANVENRIKEQLSQNKKQEFLKHWTEQKKNEAKIVIEPKYQAKNPDPLAGQAAPAGMIPAQTASNAPAEKVKH